MEDFSDKEQFDLYIVVSSIVCHDLEIETIKNLSKKNLKVFSIGPFASTVPNIYIIVDAIVAINRTINKIFLGKLLTSNII
jgi:hypothetical protein